MNQFLVLEPSKTGKQHITLISGYLRALLSNDEIKNNYSLRFLASNSTYENISDGIRDQINHKSIPVMDPAKRRLILKSILEFLVVFFTVLKLHKNDRLLVTCMLSPALFLLELVAKIMPRRNVFIVLHGELETLIDPDLKAGLRSYGYWCRKWWNIRKKTSFLSIVVIDPFIKEKLISLDQAKFEPMQIHSICHPIEISDAVTTKPNDLYLDKPRVCFLGYKSEFKGFEVFEKLGKKRKEFQFLAIGGGQVCDVNINKSYPLDRAADYGVAISHCDIAIFPYTKAYDISLSAAVLDGIAVGLFTIASSRGCFLALQDRLGSDYIFCYRNDQELDKVLNNYLNETKLVTKQDRLERLKKSQYSNEKISDQFSSILT